MIRSWVEQGQLIHIPYPDAAQDPTGQIHPLTFFLFHRAHDFCAMYPPLFPFLSSVAYRTFGFGGLILVPLLCGLGTICVMDRIARRLRLRFRLLLLFALGLATPLLLYSVVFWDHTAQMLFAALAGFWMLRAVQENSFRAAAFAGTMLGLGMWVHELFLALFAAVWLASLPFLKRWRPVPGGLLVGFILTMLVWAAFNFVVYGSFGGPHLSANVLQNNADHPFSLPRILDETQFVERAIQQIAGVAIFGSRDAIFPLYLMFICLITVYTFIGWVGRKPARVLPLLGLAAAGLAVRLLLQARGATGGLLLATPLLIPALAVPWGVHRAEFPASVNAIFYAWLSRTCWLFILFMLINPMSPGTDWGSRYLLAVLPLLALLSVHALEQQCQQVGGRWRIMAVVNVVGVVGLSMVCQISGLLWVRRSLAYGQTLNAQIRTISAPILVTDTDLNAQLVDDAPPEQSRFCVRTDSDAALLSTVLRRRQPSEVAFCGNDLGATYVENALTEAGLSYTMRDARPLWKVDRAREEGGELQFVRYVVTVQVPRRQEKHGQRKS